MEEDMQKEFMELRQDVVESKTDIADNKQNIAYQVHLVLVDIRTHTISGDWH
jgi:hypothetical protein